jgi:hypothetical protein
MKSRLFLSIILTVCASFSLTSAFAGDLVVTRYFSGLWEQPHHESQGIMLQIIDQEDQDGDPKAVAYWFTYGDDQETAWYMAIGEVEGDRVLMDLYTSSGAGFLQADSESLNPVEVTGELNLWFHNCNKGMAQFVMGDIEGEFEIKRLASLYNSRCSGGLSDNTPGDAKPLMLEVELLPPADGMNGKGKARFWERPDRMDFHVSAEDIADGDYLIFACDTELGPLTVFEGEGATQFRSPEMEGKLNLVFDPRECPIEIRQAGSVYLTSGEDVLAEKKKGPKDKGDKMKVSIELESTGQIDGAEGEVEYEVKMNETEFEVEIKGVPMGSYGFFVAGEQEGSLDVLVDFEKTKLKFSDPQKDDREFLDFEPWDKIIEVRDAANVAILEVTFPSA